MRWKCTCAYDGTNFSGWQSQKNCKTVQDSIEKRLNSLLKHSNPSENYVRIHGSGRTDTGVHAIGQVFHFDANWSYDENRLLNAMRNGLPSSILISSIEKVSDDFHSRFSAKGKVYAYNLFCGYPLPQENLFCWALRNQTLDIEKFKEASKYILGEHDFSPFRALSRDSSDSDNTTKHLRRLDISVDFPRIKIVLEANGFLYKMARFIVGTLVKIGLRKFSIDDLIFMLKNKTRPPLISAAPASGLFLEKVLY